MKNQQAPEPSREQQAFEFMREREVYAAPAGRRADKCLWKVYYPGGFDVESKFYESCEWRFDFFSPVDALLAYRDWLASKGEERSKNE